MFLISWKTQDKSVSGAVSYQKTVSVGMLKICVEPIIDIRRGEVYGKTGLVFTCAGRGEKGARDGGIIKLFLTVIGTVSGDSGDINGILPCIGT